MKYFLRLFLSSLLILVFFSNIAYAENAVFAKYRERLRKVFQENYSDLFANEITKKIGDKIKEECYKAYVDAGYTKEALSKSTFVITPDMMDAVIAAPKFNKAIKKWLREGDAKDFYNETLDLAFNFVKPSLFLSPELGGNFLTVLDTLVTMPYQVILASLETAVVSMKEYKMGSVYNFYISRRLSKEPADKVFELIRNPSAKEVYSGHASSYNTFYGQCYELFTEYQKATGKDFYPYPKNEIEMRVNNQFYNSLQADLEDEVKYFENMRNEQNMEIKRQCAEYKMKAKQAVREFSSKLQALGKEKLQFLEDRPAIYKQVKDGFFALKYNEDPKPLSSALQTLDETYKLKKELDDYNKNIESDKIIVEGYDVSVMKEKLELYYINLGGTGAKSISDINYSDLKNFNNWCKLNIINIYEELEKGTLYIGPTWTLSTKKTIKYSKITPKEYFRIKVAYSFKEKQLGKIIRYKTEYDPLTKKEIKVPVYEEKEVITTKVMGFNTEEEKQKWMNDPKNKEKYLSMKDISGNVSETGGEEVTETIKDKTIVYSQSPPSTDTKPTPYREGNITVLSISSSVSSNTKTPFLSPKDKDLVELVKTAKRYMKEAQTAFDTQLDSFDKQLEYIVEKINEVKSAYKINEYIDKDGNLIGGLPKTKIGDLDFAAELKMAQKTKDSLDKNLYPRMTSLVENKKIKPISELKENLKLLQEVKSESAVYMNSISGIINKESDIIRLEQIHSDLSGLNRLMSNLAGREIVINGSKSFSFKIDPEKDEEFKKLNYTVVSFDFDKFNDNNLINKDVVNRLQKLGEALDWFGLFAKCPQIYRALYANYQDLTAILDKYIEIIDTILKEREKSLKLWREFINSGYKETLIDCIAINKSVDDIKNSERNFINLLKDFRLVNFRPNINNYNFDNVDSPTPAQLNQVTNRFMQYRINYEKYAENKKATAEKIKSVKDKLASILPQVSKYPLQTEEIMDLLSGVPKYDIIPVDFTGFLDYINKSLEPKEYSSTEYRKYLKLYDEINKIQNDPENTDPAKEQKLRFEVKKTLEEMFVSYENQNRRGFMKYVADDFRSNLTTGQNYSQLDQALLDDFRNLSDINFILYYKGNPIYYPSNNVIVVNTDWSRRATIKSTGQEWTLDRKSTTFTFKVNGDKLTLSQMQGDTAFGLSAPFGDITITEGKINQETVTGEVVVSGGKITSSSSQIYTDGNTPDINVLNNSWYFSTKSIGAYDAGDLYYTSNAGDGHSYIGIPDDSARIKRLSSYTSLNEVTSVPYGGYQAFYQDPMVGDIYAVQSRSTGKYAVIQLRSFGANMLFEYKYPVNNE